MYRLPPLEAVFHDYFSEVNWTSFDKVLSVMVFVSKSIFIFFLFYWNVKLKLLLTEVCGTSFQPVGRWHAGASVCNSRKRHDNEYDADDLSQRFNCRLHFTESKKSTSTRIHWHVRNDNLKMQTVHFSGSDDCWENCQWRHKLVEENRLWYQVISHDDFSLNTFFLSVSIYC